MPRVGALIAILLWGISFVATKAALRELTPIALISVRFILGTAVLFVLLAAKRVSPIPPRDAIPQLAIMGFIGIFVHQMLQAHGIALTSAVNAGWLIGLTPIWSAFLAGLFLRERFTARKIAGFVIGFAGAVLVITRGEPVFLPSTAGDLLILASTLNWAIYTIVGHPTIRRLGALRATGGSMFLGTLMLVPAFVARGGWRELSGVSAAGWGSILFLGIGCSAFGYFL
ncbi:MAG TPA: DMT family transporter, partial [Thermoanaerobaculia bacterium]